MSVQRDVLTGLCYQNRVLVHIQALPPIAKEAL